MSARDERAVRLCREFGFEKDRMPMSIYPAVLKVVSAALAHGQREGLENAAQLMENPLLAAAIRALAEEE